MMSTNAERNNIKTNTQNDYDIQMTQKYENRIQNGELVICANDKQLSSLAFIDNFNVKQLKIIGESLANFKLRNKTITEFTICDPQYNLKVDNMELENIEVLRLKNNKLVNDNLSNISKFKKLYNLNISNSNVDLTHIHTITSLTSLSMQECGLKYLTQIKQLINLQILDISHNSLQNIDSIKFLKKLKELNISFSNSQINITPLQYFTNITKLEIEQSKIISICVLRSLTNLEFLNLANNKIVHVDTALNSMTKLQYLKLNGNLMSDLTALQKHPNFSKLVMFNQRQQFSEKSDILRANRLRNIERPILQLKDLNKKRQVKYLFKDKVNALIERTKLNQIHFTSNVVLLFQQFNSLTE
ncbi:leucine-rich_repeat protein [Hexamita inflata]|uniref:Leucine-rich repeat protein n=1 Tax=Hexamita inflata TaxID=28002 RepID=A0AA86TPA8_9EUKA|nr:leucine-rich repeat protein [Hexamita inflata]